MNDIQIYMQMRPSHLLTITIVFLEFFFNFTQTVFPNSLNLKLIAQKFQISQVPVR